MNGVQWWCAARGDAWTWAWTPYPGIWLAVAMAAVATARWRAAGPGDNSSREEAWRPWAAWSAVVLLWLTLDWPAGALGAGYLASVHAAQYLMLAMVVPPLALLGVPLGAWERLARRASLMRVLHVATDPFRAMLSFTLVMVFSHQPWLVDTLMKTPLGNFALDAAWLASGVVFWWSLCAPLPARPAFAPLLKIVYVFAGTVAHVFIGMWMLIADYPIFATYELAPPFAGLTARADQQWAGGVFLMVGSPLVLVVMSVIFFRWIGIGEEPDGA
jgi:cytochrome c oxidase assembly factor CtaG